MAIPWNFQPYPFLKPFDVWHDIVVDKELRCLDAIDIVPAWAASDSKGDYLMILLTEKPIQLNFKVCMIEKQTQNSEKILWLYY